MSERQYQYNADYRDTLVLDGMEVQLRLLCAEDAPLLIEGFAHLSAESRHSRFFGGKRQLSDKEAEYLTHLDNESHLAIVAVELFSSGKERGLGVARFIRFSTPDDTAEVAVTVIDEVQHHGLGRELCLRLLDAAKERAIRCLHFEILSSNLPMVALLHELAPEVREQEASGVISADVLLSEEDLAQSETP